MTAEALGSVSPFFVVTDLAATLRFYEERLGFETRMRAPEKDPFFAIIGHGSVQIHLKFAAPDVVPVPNRTLHAWTPWDAFVYVEDPEALAEAFAVRGATFCAELATRDDGLRGFEVQDPDGYVLFFGRPD
ncbi:MAG: VOC family protein [Myxococcota bacterium]